MIKNDNVSSLSDFQQNAAEHLERLKETGNPQVLTIGGRPALVVQSTEAYQKLLDAADLGDSVRVLRKRLAQKRRKGVPAKQVLSKIRKRLGISSR